MKNITTVVILMLALALTPLSISAQDQEAELTDITINPASDRLETRLVIGTTVNYESFTLFNPNRLVIDLLQVKAFSCDPEVAVNASGVLQIRTAKNQTDVTRVVFDLEERVPAYSIEETDQGLLIVFTPAAPVQEAPVEAQVIPEEKKIEPEPVAKKPAPVVTKTPRVTRPEPKTQPARRESETGRRPSRIGINAGGGMYFVHSSDFQDVYGTSAFSGGGGLSFTFPIGSHEDLGVAVDVNVVSATGETTYTAEEVKLNLMPMSLSVFYTRHFGRISPFAGLGLDYINYKEEYPETFAVSETSGNVLGYNVQLGTNINITDSFSARAYFKLHIAKKTENEIEINLSGNEYGIGLIYYFNLK